MRINHFVFALCCLGILYDSKKRLAPVISWRNCWALYGKKDHCTARGRNGATAIIWGPKKKILTIWLVRGSKCAQGHGECSRNSFRALKWCVWKRHSKNCFFWPKMAIFAPKTSWTPMLWSPILMQSFKKVLFGSIIHPQLKKLKKNAIRCPKTQRFFQKTSNLGIVGRKTQEKSILESLNLYCRSIWLL